MAWLSGKTEDRKKSVTRSATGRVGGVIESLPPKHDRNKLLIVITLLFGKKVTSVNRIATTACLIT